MKKFLEDLEKELKKLKVNENDIAEILADHKEMIENGKAEGLDEKDMNKKFGEPEKIAKAISEDSQETALNSSLYQDAEDCTKELKEEGYSLVKSFFVEDLSEFIVKLVSEDIAIVPYDGESIIVYQKDISDIDKYVIKYENSIFELRKEKKLIGFSIKKDSGKFIVKVPETAKISSLLFSTVSGDLIANNIVSDKSKVKSVSGDIKLSNFKTESFATNTVSGDIELSKITADSLNISTVSGDLKLNKSIVKDSIDINTVSGDTKAKDGECVEFMLKSVSGDFDAIEFYPAKVTLSSVSGDITIKNNDKSREIEIVRKKSLSGDINIS